MDQCGWTHAWVGWWLGQKQCALERSSTWSDVPWSCRLQHNSSIAVASVFMEVRILHLCSGPSPGSLREGHPSSLQSHVACFLCNGCVTTYQVFLAHPCCRSPGEHTPRSGGSSWPWCMSWALCRHTILWQRPGWWPSNKTRCHTKGHLQRVSSRRLVLGSWTGFIPGSRGFTSWEVLRNISPWEVLGSLKERDCWYQNQQGSVSSRPFCMYLLSLCLRAILLALLTVLLKSMDSWDMAVCLWDVPTLSTPSKRPGFLDLSMTWKLEYARTECHLLNYWMKIEEGYTSIRN